MLSTNFDHLESISPELRQLGMRAERYFADDPNTSLIKSRQFAEYMIKEIAAFSGCYDPARQDTPYDLLRQLTASQRLPREVADLFHAVRKGGNDAVHAFRGTAGDALTAIKFCRNLGIWYRRSYGRDPDFKPGPFVPPRSSGDLDAATQEQIETYQRRVQEAEARLAEVAASAEELARAKAAAEELARQACQDSEEWAKAALEQESTAAQLTARLSELQAQAEAEPEQAQEELKLAARRAASSLELDEEDTRVLIDVQLIDMGWEADSKLLHHARGTRPEKGRNLAIAEWPAEGGRADYVLFIGEKCVGVIEAKRGSADVPGVLAQSRRYAQTLKLDAANIAEGGPWQHGLDEPFQVPFIFATNGRPFVQQWKTKSGIWHNDLRRATNHPAPMRQWFAPHDLVKKLEIDVDAAAGGLAEDSFGRGALRPYQEEAVNAVETAIQNGQRDILVSMATGTGKTRTCIALMYRLLKHKRFNRILFLVDRTALADQTEKEMATTNLEGMLNFSQVYNVSGLNSREGPTKDTHVHVATVQSLIARIEDDRKNVSERPTPGFYDCVIVDEAHRGYTLDADLRENDLTFRSLADYQSAYRQVLDYFDAVRIALTATPALHTLEIFGRPVFHYGYRQAVVEGYLIDHLPPKRITTALAEAGIHFKGGEEVEIIDRKTGEVSLFDLPDEVDLDYDLAAFNKQVYSENFNRTVCQALAREIPPDAAGKTLIFAARDDHADDVVRLLVEELRDEYGASAVPDGLVQKITGKIDRPKEAILRFKNDPLPKYVVTVELLTTGIDVRSICNLVFLRRVKSRILYEQMIGRATRLCPEINKQHFRIYDAVDLYDELQEMSDMRPVVVKPEVPLRQLVSDFFNAPEPEDREWVAGQVIVKMRGLAANIDEDTRESFTLHTGQTPEAALQTLSLNPAGTLEDWLRRHPRAVELLERRPVKVPGPEDGVTISTHDDELLRITEIFGKNTTPEDYIEGFERFVRENMNKLPALIAVTQKPRDLTRKELTELVALLDEQRFSEKMLDAAYSKARNADIAAHIIGYVRQAALGDPLVPYPERVEAAIRKIEASRPWSKRQRDWLRRIGRALKDKPVADPTLLEQGSFADKGGYRHIAQEFGEDLEAVLHQFNEAIWGPDAA